MVKLIQQERVKVIHGVDVDMAAIITLAGEIVAATRATYPSDDDEIAAVAVMIEAAQREAVQEAFRMGKAVQKKSKKSC